MKSQTTKQFFSLFCAPDGQVKSENATRSGGVVVVGSIHNSETGRSRSAV